MADATVTAQDEEQALKVPPEVAEQFGDLIALVKESRSMDHDERQYWVDVLPIMSEEQIENLRNILDNEKKQLAAAEANYHKSMDKAVQNVAHEFDEEAYLAKKRAREAAEKKYELEEKGEEAEVLEEIQSL